MDKVSTRLLSNVILIDDVRIQDCPKHILGGGVESEEGPWGQWRSASPTDGGPGRVLHAPQGHPRPGEPRDGQGQGSGGGRQAQSPVPGQGGHLARGDPPFSTPFPTSAGAASGPRIPSNRCAGLRGRTTATLMLAARNPAPNPRGRRGAGLKRANYSSVVGSYPTGGVSSTNKCLSWAAASPRR